MSLLAIINLSQYNTDNNKFKTVCMGVLKTLHFNAVFPH